MMILGCQQRAAAMEGELRPRLCYITKGDRGYGFHLHGERNKGGQFIRKVEPGSSADLAGVKAGDRVVEVNGENVENETHHEVVNRIQEVDFRTRLLVVDSETDEFLQSRGLVCTEELAIEMGTLSPRPSPAPTPSSSPLPPILLRENGALSPKINRLYTLPAVHPLTINYSSTPTTPTGTVSHRSSTSPTPSSSSLPTILLRDNSALSPKINRLYTLPTVHPLTIDYSSAPTTPTGTVSPQGSPSPTPSSSHLHHILLRENGTLSPKIDRLYTLPTVHPLTIDYSSAPTTPTGTEGKSSRSSVASSLATDTEEEPSPEPTIGHLPRLCHLMKSDSGYGFNLHSHKKKIGQFVRSVDPGSTAEHADIRPGDRIVEVNGLNIDGLKHSEVVAFIRAGGDEVQLLVVDPETDELFQHLGITPTTSHVKEIYVDEVTADSMPQTPSPTTDFTSAHPPIINVTLTDPSISPKSAPKSRANGSTASQSSRSSTTQSEISSSDMSIQVPDEDDTCVSDPFTENGLRLSPTAAEARKKALASRKKKRAPPMDWSKKKEIFSNY